MQAAVHFLVGHSISSRWAEILVQGPVVIVVFIIAFSGTRRMMSWIFSGSLGAALGAAAAIWLCTFAIYATAEGCFTMDLSVNKELFAQTQNDVIQIDLALGGATSTVADADLNLCRADNSKVETLTLQDMGGGRYVTYLRSSTLSTGNYRVELKYPQTSLTSSFPFLHSTTEKSVGFLVIQ